MRHKRQNQPIEDKQEDYQFLTTREVAEHLRVHQRTVQRWISLGHLKATKVGPRVWRVRREDLDAFIKTNTSGREEDLRPGDN
ncbi:helix-turn-helix domain-containing protein [Pelatocladus sp. BLCC-F211]|uniref:helix-turn-helix domain-containing protein n=1 Tax=Pelatocladus sp. BLCC-F211 TaxID=3342752 RepID=UPI0035BB098F